MARKLNADAETRMRILVIDDDPHLLKLARHALEHAGAEVVATADPRTAVDEARSARFDAVLLDVIMPEFDGFQLLERLRQAIPADLPPVIVMSAASDRVPAERLAACGVRGVIPKPFDPTKLAERVWALLGIEHRGSAAAVPADQREAFLQRLPDQLDLIDRSFDVFSHDCDPAVLETAFTQFHRIAGLASTFGFPRITGFAREGEAATDAARADDSAMTDATLERCRDLARAIRDEANAAVFSGAADETMRGARPGVRVLVVDSEDERPSPLRPLQADASFEISFVRSAGEARRAIAEGAPQIAVIAAELRDGAGLEVAEQLRAQPRGGDTSIVLLARRPPRFADARRAVALEITRVVEDPASPTAAIGAVRQIISHRFGPAPRALCIGLGHLAAPFLSVLESTGYKTRAVDDGTHVHVDLDSFAPDVVITSLEGGRRTALDLTRHVRLLTDPEWPPVVLISASSDPALTADAARAGADNVLTLPTTRSAFLAVVSNHVDASRARRHALQRDPLTGCWSEEAFLRRADRRLRNHRGTKQLIALLEVAASPEEDAGARQAISLAALLRRRLRDTDEIGRCGASSFAVLMERIDLEQASSLFEGLRREAVKSAGPAYRVGFALASPGMTAAGMLHLARLAAGTRPSNDAAVRTDEARIVRSEAGA